MDNQQEQVLDSSREQKHKAQHRVVALHGVCRGQMILHFFKGVFASAAHFFKGVLASSLPFRPQSSPLERGFPGLCGTSRHYDSGSLRTATVQPAEYRRSGPAGQAPSDQTRRSHETVLTQRSRRTFMEMNPFLLAV